jgi:hypothetical protein
VDPKKIEAMKDWPCHKNLKIFCGFLGLTCYYYKFVQNYGKIASPLTTLLKKMLLVGLQQLINPSNP